jgi:hypothetical protein
MALTQQVNFTGVASTDLATSFPILEAAVAELEAQAAAANTTALYSALGGTVQASISRLEAIRLRLQAINRG